MSKIQQKENNLEKSKLSLRRRNTRRLIENVGPDTHILAMSATPFVNSIDELGSVMKLLDIPDIESVGKKKSIGNIAYHNGLLQTVGFQYVPKFKTQINRHDYFIQYDQKTAIALKQLEDDASGLTKQQILLPLKLRDIKPLLRPGTIIFTKYVGAGILKAIGDFLTKYGYTHEFFTGAEHQNNTRESNRLKFINRKVDILVGSKPITEGVDELHQVCNNMIILSLPDSYKEQKQLEGRIRRKDENGKGFSEADVWIPLCGKWEGDKTSPDYKAWKRIENKQVQHNALNYGELPSHFLYEDTIHNTKAMKRELEEWMKRMEKTGQFKTEKTQEIEVAPEEDKIRKFSLGKINCPVVQNARKMSSKQRGTYVRKHPEQLERYHDLRDKQMKKWAEIPVERLAKKITNTRDVVADLGCGRAKLARLLPQNKVHSFDFQELADGVIVCDYSDLSEHLKDKSVDVVVICQALWGKKEDVPTYMKEVRRILKKNGRLLVADIGKHWKNGQELMDLLVDFYKFKIDPETIEVRGPFFYFEAVKVK